MKLGPVSLIFLGAAIACTDDAPPACRSILSCCSQLAPELADSCRQSYDQALAQDRQLAAQQCQDALTALHAAGQCGGGGMRPPIPGFDGGMIATDGGLPPGADASVVPHLPPSQGLSQPCDPSYGI